MEQHRATSVAKGCNLAARERSFGDQSSGGLNKTFVIHG
jgi:hypothetical protein